MALAAVIVLAVTLWSAYLRVMPGGRRADDVLYVVLAVIPGAVVMGRLAHALSFPDAYLADPRSLVDFSRGSISLVGAVLGGFLTGAYVCRLLGRSAGRWADAAAVPLLVGIGLGKVAVLLGGSGQGSRFDGAWAVAFEGPGPWISPDPAIPAHPAQIYEGLLTLVGLVLFVQLARLARSPATVGGLFLAALTWWLAVRFMVGFAWRDEPLLGPLGGEQVVTLVALIVVAGSWAWVNSAGRRRRRRQRRRNRLKPTSGASSPL